LTGPGSPAYQSGRLAVDGHDLRALADRLGTPCFLLSEARVRANHEALRRGLAAGGLEGTIRYCVKTNSEAGVLEILARGGSHALVSHPAEVELAVRCGFGPDRLAYQRPVLLDEDLAAVLRAGVDLVHAGRLEDLDLIEAAAAALGRPVRVSLRLRNDSWSQLSSPLNFLSRRLGLRASEVAAAARRAQGSRWLKLVALNFYRGTQQPDVSRYQSRLRSALRLAARLQREAAVTIEEINLGGGIPSPGLRRNSIAGLPARWRDASPPPSGPWDLEAFARALGASFQREAARAGLAAPPRLAVEPGRCIVGDAGFLLTRVRAAQRSWVFLDASANHLAESTLLFTRRILTEAAPGPAARHHRHLSGATLNTRDVIDLFRRLPPLRAGDLLLLCDAGAYSISRASRYAGLSPAVHLLAGDGSLRTIRRAEDLRDLTGPMVIASEGPGGS
jgi:diaminopimelate decarboxylase